MTANQARNPAASPSTSLEKRRAVARVSAQYFLQAIEVAKAPHQGDPICAIIFTALWSANVSHVRGRGDLGDTPVPNQMRKPISVSRLSTLVGMSPETVRRYVVRLIDQGLCERVGRHGVLVPADVFLRDDMMQCLERQVSVATSFAKALRALMDDGA